MLPLNLRLEIPHTYIYMCRFDRRKPGENTCSSALPSSFFRTFCVSDNDWRIDNYILLLFLTVGLIHKRRKEGANLDSLNSKKVGHVCLFNISAKFPIRLHDFKTTDKKFKTCLNQMRKIILTESSSGSILHLSLI